MKVKQFSLQGARIQNDWQGPQMVKYKNKLHPWKYIVVLPISRNPIKISSPNLTSLKPVHEGIRRVLASHQRDRGAGPNTAVTVPRPMPSSASPSRRGPYGEYDSRAGDSSYDQYPRSSQRDVYAQQGQGGSPGNPYGPSVSPNRDPNGTQGGYHGGSSISVGTGGVAGQRSTTHPDYRY